MIPTAEECYALMEQYGMLDNIKAHSIVVEKVARIIASAIIETGYEISIERVTAGALMHDIGKTLCLGSKNDHAAKGMEICIRNNFTEISDIVGEHIRLSSYESGTEIRVEEIVYYSDKRVNHDKVVSLEERLEYLLVRYARGKKSLNRLIRENFKNCKIVEKKLFADLDFGPEDLEELVGHPISF